MRRVLITLMIVSSLPALAQKEEIFGSGKEIRYRTEMMDKRFNKSKLAKMLEKGTDNPACVQLLGGLFVALAEIAPTLHKRDQNFTLDPTLQNAIQTQLSTPAFPAMAYLVSMVRRVMIEKRLPDSWLATAADLNKTVKIIDMGKLKMLNDTVEPIDSAYFTIPVLKDRYLKEVREANSAVTTDVASEFRDAYLDRDVAWPGAILVDAGENRPRKGKHVNPGEAGELVAVLEWYPPNPNNTELNLVIKAPVKVKPIRIYAKLAPKQYYDIERAHKGQRMMVRGRFWEMNRDVTELEVRDALLLDDRDFSQGVILGDPNTVARCPAAINELTGLKPHQPGGFAH